MKYDCAYQWHQCLLPSTHHRSCNTYGYNNQEFRYKNPKNEKDFFSPICLTRMNFILILKRTSNNKREAIRGLEIHKSVPYSPHTANSCTVKIKFSIPTMTPFLAKSSFYPSLFMDFFFKINN